MSLKEYLKFIVIAILPILMVVGVLCFFLSLIPNEVIQTILLIVGVLGITFSMINYIDWLSKRNIL